METSDVRVSRVSPGTIGLFEGLFAAVIGFAVSCAAWISVGANFTPSTEVLLRGMLFGFAPGLGAVIAATIIYFVAGYIVGLVHGALFNVVANWMGSLEVGTKDLGEEVRQAATRAGTRRAEPTFGETVDQRRIDR